MPYRAERISGRCRSAGHPAPPSKQPPGQGAPYVSEGNVKIHNRQDGNNQKLWRVTMEYSKEDLMEAKKQVRYACIQRAGISPVKTTSSFFTWAVSMVAQYFGAS